MAHQERAPLSFAAVTTQPDFPPRCKHLTPGAGDLEALTTDYPASIPHVTSISIANSDGTHRAVDAIV
ncbi:hypothetical protein IMSHALPRED_010524 [Imshaugia aleurites]|uniref:Uncharacterized protein n=1 Tax=Imshaugia aleurites TaxID=172621 RepID=A0A8H3EUE5_9LECA|nr:hypothetical protein IMSHALPRED_010524 [Imshaugia aleurites]